MFASPLLFLDDAAVAADTAVPAKLNQLVITPMFDSNHSIIHRLQTSCHVVTWLLKIGDFPLKADYWQYPNSQWCALDERCEISIPTEETRWTVGKIYSNCLHI